MNALQQYLRYRSRERQAKTANLSGSAFVVWLVRVAARSRELQLIRILLQSALGDQAATSPRSACSCAMSKPGAKLGFFASCGKIA